MAENQDKKNVIDKSPEPGVNEHGTMSLQKEQSHPAGDLEERSLDDAAAEALADGASETKAAPRLEQHIEKLESTVVAPNKAAEELKIPQPGIYAEESEPVIMTKIGEQPQSIRDLVPKPKVQSTPESLMAKLKKPTLDAHSGAQEAANMHRAAAESKDQAA